MRDDPAYRRNILDVLRVESIDRINVLTSTVAGFGRRDQFGEVDLLEGA